MPSNACSGLVTDNTIVGYLGCVHKYHGCIDAFHHRRANGSIKNYWISGCGSNPPAGPRPEEPPGSSNWIMIVVASESENNRANNSIGEMGRKFDRRWNIQLSRARRRSEIFYAQLIERFIDFSWSIFLKSFLKHMPSVSFQKNPFYWRRFVGFFSSLLLNFYRVFYSN